MFVKKTKFRAWFFIKEKDIIKLYKKKRFKSVNKKGIFKYKNEPYEPIIDYPTFKNGNKSYFFFLLGSKTQITTYDITIQDSDAEIKDLLYTQEALYQGFKAIKEKGLSINWIHLVLVGIAFLLAGWILGNYIPIGALS